MARLQCQSLPFKLVLLQWLTKFQLSFTAFAFCHYKCAFFCLFLFFFFNMRKEDFQVEMNLYESIFMCSFPFFRKMWMKNVYLLSGYPVCTCYSIIYFQYDSKGLIPRFSLIHFHCRYPHGNAITGKKKTNLCKWQFVLSGESRSKPVDMLSNCICRHYQRTSRTTVVFFHFIL